MAAIAEFFILLSLSSLFLAEARRGGFSVNLIHRDSPLSPLYNPKQTKLERWVAAFNRSYERANHLKKLYTKASVSPSASVLNNHGSYLMKLSFGTPPVEINAVIDSGSHFIWTQCQPCSQCHPVKDPVFDPKASSSYRDITCNTRECKALGNSVCGDNDKCKYRIHYTDGSFSNGTFAFETITLDKVDGGRVSFTGVMFGCANYDGGTFTETVNGVIGLGVSTFSLVAQMGKVVAGIFSHCFVPLSYDAKPSKINFGDNAIVSGDRVVSTLLHTKSPDNYFYYVNLEAISVNDARFDFPGFSPSTQGNIIVDSGTTFTMLPKDYYTRIEAAVAAAIPVARANTPEAFSSRLCYGVNDRVQVPKIAMHFSGADVALPPENVFLSASQDLECFTFGASPVDFAIYGNTAMMNFLVGYNSLSQIVSFKPIDCTTLF